ncbi:MAG: hypothetical protein PVF47_20940, partial [Anaerolineae bacterium]
MNRGRLIGGIICLAIAALLGVLSFRLPADEFMFQVGEENMPWIPVAVLGVVGVALVATSVGGRQSAAVPRSQAAIAIDPDKAALNRRLEMIGWGCFLIMLGGFILVPHTVVAKGFWSIGVGVIMLGLNAARYALNIRMSGFTTFLGIISLVGGILQLLGLEAI